MVNDAPDRVEYVTPNATFWKFWEAAHKNTPNHRDLRETAVLALDPGETTGVALYDPKSKTIALFQWDTRDLLEAGRLLHDVVAPDLTLNREVVFEDYRIYGWKTQDHAFSSVHTIQWIGVIKYILKLLRVKFTHRMASTAKTFCTDEMLKRWGVYSAGMRHGRDALRHLMYHLMWPDRVDASTTTKG